MERAKRSTLKEISRCTKTSISTVAAVLRNDPSCFAGPELRKKILSAARELNYRPNIIARMLRTKKSNTLGLILPNMQISSTAANMEIIEGLVWKKGYHLFIGYSQNDSAKEETLMADLVNRYVDGLIFVVGSDISSERPYLKHLIAQKFPIVSINKLQEFALPSVSTDFRKGGELAGEYLVKLGHRNFAAITGDPDDPTIKNRTEGFQEKIKKAGARMQIVMASPKKNHKGISKVIYLEEYVKEGYKLAQKILSRKTRPTAIFSGNDELGVGVIKAAINLGIKIPQELSVVGFDDSPAATFAPVFLTTIRQPKEEIARKATEIMFKMIAEKKEIRADDTSRQILLEPKLIIRDSTAVVRKK